MINLIGKIDKLKTWVLSLSPNSIILTIERHIYCVGQFLFTNLTYYSTKMVAITTALYNLGIVYYITILDLYIMLIKKYTEC